MQMQRVDAVVDFMGECPRKPMNLPGFSKYLPCKVSSPPPSSIYQRAVNPLMLHLAGAISLSGSKAGSMRLTPLMNSERPLGMKHCLSIASHEMKMGDASLRRHVYESPPCPSIIAREADNCQYHLPRLSHYARSR